MNHRHRGMLLLDGLFALGVIGALLTAMVVAAGQFRGSLRQLDAQRRAARAAEGLGELARRGYGSDQLQQAAAADGCTVELRRLEPVADAPGWTWVELRVSVERADAVLVALAPAGEASP